MTLFSQISLLDKVLFAKNLALMIKAGLPLREGVATIKEQTKNKTFSKILEDVLKSIDNGQSLADSLTDHPSVFDSLYINMIKVGEESGTLEENLGYLALQLEKSYQLRSKVKAAMVYPSIILTAIIALGTALTLFILPQITPIFKALDVPLPLATRLLISFTELVQTSGLTILIILVALLFVFILLFRIRTVKLLVHELILKLPIAGGISRNVNIAHFSRALGVLLRSGLPVVSALKITENSLGNLAYRREVARIAAEVKEGKAISSYLKEREALFPLMVSRMVGVGEKTGNLEETLSYLGRFYETEVDKSAKTLSTVLEPVLLLLIGLTVGLIAVAIISPIYEITRGLRL